MSLAAEELSRALARTNVTRATPCTSCAAETAIGGIAAKGPNYPLTGRLAPAVVLRDKPRGHVA